MSKLSPEEQEGTLLTSRMLDGDLDSAGIARLEEILLSSRAARRRYHRMIGLHTALQWRTGAVEPSVRIDDEPEDPSNADNPAETLILPALRVVPEQAEESNFPEHIEQRPRPRKQKQKSRFPSFRFLAIAAAVLIAVSMGVAVMFRSRLPFAGRPQTVAVLTAGTEAQWQPGFSPRSGASAIEQGEQLSLTVGSVEIAFSAGASVVVQAPAQFSTDTSGTMTLTSGRMAAVVPPRARGFTVNTPYVSVKDLGTEFGLKCGEGTATEVDVFKGTVEATPRSDHPATVKLVAGDAATISAGTLTTTEGAADSQKFPRHFAGVIPPIAFSDTDVGDPGSPGSAVYAGSDGTWTVNGAGFDIWLRHDQFHFSSVRLGGNGTIVCRILTPLTLADGSRRSAAKCGIMFRALADPGSPFVDLVLTEGRGLQMITRDTANTEAATVTRSASSHLPVWIKLTRVGDAFTGSYSRDGSNWTTIGTHITQLPTEALVGLVVSSTDKTRVGTATFSDVTVIGNTAAR